MVTWTQCVLYGLPGFGFGAVTVMIGLFLPSLYADHLGVPLSAIGTVTSLVQVFDAVTDPVLGYVSDRLTYVTSCGRRRPFMISGSWLLAGCFVALFTPPQTGTWSLSLAWAASWALLTQLMVTVARVPWLAWGIELSHDYHEKTRLVSLRELMWIFGSLAAAILPLILENVDLNEFAQLTVMSVFWALCIVVSGTVCFCTIPEGTVAAAEPPSSVWSFMRLLLTTRAAWSLWLAAVLMTMATTSNALLYPFFVRYVLQEEDGVSLLLGLYILVGALGVPFWAMASKRFDKRQSLVLATLIQSLALLVAFVMVGAQSMAVYTGCILVAGVSFGGVPVIRFSMLADVADVLQLKAAGKKDEGKLVAVLDVSSKLAASALISVGFTVIDVSGYRADQAQGDSAKLAIRVFYGLVPALLGVFSALVILFLYPLDRAKHAEVLAELGKPETVGSTSLG